MPRLKICLSAYACEPYKGSEPGVGWNWVAHMGHIHDVHVITRSNNRQAIESAPATARPSGVTWHYYDTPAWLRFWKRGARGIHAYYYLWQIGAAVQAQRLHQQIGFDLVHHVTFVNYWIPSFMWWVGIPFVWGPVGGGERGPSAFYRACGVRGHLLERVRDLVRWLAEHDPFVRRAAIRADLVFATTPQTAERIGLLRGHPVPVLSGIALADADCDQLANLPFRTAYPFRVVTIGRLIHWKGQALAMKAFAKARQAVPDMEYWVVGDGADRRRIERLAASLGVLEACRFTGEVERAIALEHLGNCDLLLHPSIHDSSGWVCLEAMAAGRPVICLALGGPAQLVTPSTGIVVNATSPEMAVAGIAEGLIRLAQSPTAREAMGRAGREHVRANHSWSNRAVLMSEHYAQCVSTERRPHCSSQCS